MEFVGASFGCVMAGHSSLAKKADKWEERRFKEFLAQPENKLLGSMAFEMLARQAEATALQAKLDYLSSQYDALGPKAELPEPIKEFIGVIAIAIKSNDLDELNILTGNVQNRRILEQPVVQNALVKACTERGMTYGDLNLLTSLLKPGMLAMIEQPVIAPITPSQPEQAVQRLGF